MPLKGLQLKQEFYKVQFFGPLLFLIYINNLSNELSSNLRLFADDTSLFSVVRDTNLLANAFNDDLLKTNNWTYQWKMSFNLDPSKQAQKVFFSRKIKKPSHPVLIFNNNLTRQYKLNTKKTLV